LATKHGNLVTEHDDLGGQVVAIAAARTDQLEGLDEGKVEE
jgi:hypothetical protein